MAFNPSSPVTGAAQSNLTSPTYTLVADSNPNNFGKQWYVSALGGTQSGVASHTASNPFTVAQYRPPVTKMLGPVNPVTGRLQNVPMNVYKTVTRKGVLPLAGQPNKPLVITTMVEVPAGSDTADSNSIRAALSLHIGALWAQSAGLGDSTITGSI